MLISREYAKTVLSTLAQKLSGVYKKPNTGIPESDLADDVKDKLNNGLPDASELENGTAMIAVDGEWKMQEGYGYTTEPAVITFDGDLTGRTVVNFVADTKLVHVSDLVPSLSDLQGATGICYNSIDGDIEISPTCLEGSEGILIGLDNYDVDWFYVIPEPVIVEGLSFPKSGIYVVDCSAPLEEYFEYLKQLTFGGSSATISPDLLPATYANKVTLADAEDYFDSDTVEGALEELGEARLNPVDKTDAMTQPVGRDDDGSLWTQPDGAGLLPRVVVTTRPTATVTVESGDYTETYTVGKSGVITIDLPDYGDYVITAVITGEPNSAELTVDAVKKYAVDLPLAAPVYGVEWNRVASPVWTRTDDAALFVDPVSFVNNGMTADDCSSPFDDILPWSGMVRVTDPNAGELVAIPKFYYKWTNTADKMKLQITSEARDGFHVSPAHMDRGDGHGERDVVYVGRYHCSADNYKSETGVLPKVRITRETARTGIHNLGTDIWQIDHAMWWTIGMLYLVEFANANTQATIGCGTGNGSSAESMGYTDAMPYHTGTMTARKNTYGASTQYRYIEGLWDNVYDWCDGIYFSGANVYHITNPADFSDTTGGTLTGTRATSNGIISGFTFPSVDGFEWAGYPASSDVAPSGATTVDYFCGYESYSNTGVTLTVGLDYYPNKNNGLFCRDGKELASVSYYNLGSRLQRLPNTQE